MSGLRTKYILSSRIILFNSFYESLEWCKVNLFYTLVGYYEVNNNNQVNKATFQSEYRNMGN